MQEVVKMPDKKISQAREGLNRAKIEAALELHGKVEYEYRGNISSRENGSIVKKMVEEYERNLIGK